MTEMTIRDITDFLESIAPLHLQESYDNAGLIVGHWDDTVKGILCSLDCTEDIVDEAIAKGCQLIVAHHPIVFSGLKQLNGKNYVERTVLKAIKNGIAIYAIHTNLDNVLSHGVNEHIAIRLGLENLHILAPKSPERSDIGSGVVGRLIEPMSVMEFLSHLKASMELDVIKYTHNFELNDSIQTVALCGGSGSFLLPQAKQAGAQIFITSDYKYHQFFDAENDIIIADIGHYESEKYTSQLLAELIRNKFSTFAVYFSELNTNPVSYLF